MSGVSETAQPLLRIQGLEVLRPGGAPLLQPTDLSIHAGEVVLLLGPSGSGKSTLLNLLAGLLDRRAGWTVRGRCSLPDGTLDLQRNRVAAGGIVFQNYALFDDLSVAENLAAAAEHGSGAGSDLQHFARSLLSGVEGHQQSSELSGGQQQRVAIARSLLVNRPLLFFDEPNAGLDPAQVRRLTEIIDGLRRQRGLSVIIVAHHVHELLPIVDRVLLLDPENASLQELAPDSPSLARYLAVQRAEAVPASAAAPAPRPEGRLPAAAGSETAGAAPTARGLSQRTLPRWWLRYAGHYLWLLVLAPSMLAFIVIGGLLTGFVATWSAFQFLPFADYLLPLVHDDTLTAIGLAQFRILAPLLLSILIAARNSAIIAADLGHRVYTHQIDAMISLDMDHRSYLGGGVLAATLLGSVLLTLLVLAVSVTATLLTWQAQFPEQPAALFRDSFFLLVFRDGAWLPDGWAWMLAKVVPSALASAAVGLFFGYRRKVSVRSINAAIAQAIIFGVSAALIINAAVTLLEPVKI